LNFKLILNIFKLETVLDQGKSSFLIRRVKTVFSSGQQGRIGISGKIIAWSLLEILLSSNFSCLLELLIATFSSSL
jgi:hypothetical protein